MASRAASVWVRCDAPERLAALAMITERLAADGDEITPVVTLNNATIGQLAHPRGRRDITTFLAQHKPVMTLFLGGILDPTTLTALAADRVPVILVGARPDGLREMTGGWFRGRVKPMLNTVTAAFAADPKAAEALRQLGAPRDVTFASGLPERPLTIPPYNEADRADIAGTIGTRPVWLAHGITAAECPMVLAAHRQATRRAHRLLLCVTPANDSDPSALAAAAQAAGFITAQRSHNQDPDEATQVYIADIEGESGLWHRIAPMTYLGGTLTNGACCDPFQIAALGSVVMHGLKTDPFADRFTHLVRAGASLALAHPDRLGPAVETLLAADRVAEMATAGWDVTSRGAETCNHIVALIQHRLDSGGA